MSRPLPAAPGPQWMHPDARQGLDLLLRCGERSLLRTVAISYLLLGGFGLSASLWMDGSRSKTAVFTAMMLGIPTFLTWLIWVPRTVVATRELRQLGIAATTRRFWLAIVVAWIFTIALPAFALSLLGLTWYQMLAAYSFVAAVSFLLAMLPSVVAILLLFVPAGLNTLPTPWLKTVIQTLRDAPSLMVLLGLAVAVSAGLLARHWLQPWRPLPDSRWLQPNAVRMGNMAYMYGGVLGESWLRQMDVNQQTRNMPTWAVSVGRVADYGLAKGGPVRALRAWLGSPYTPMHALDRVRQIAIIVGTLLSFPVLMSLMRIGKAPAAAVFTMSLGWSVAMALFLYVAMFPAPLFQRTARASSEYADLALLPGLGDARRTLLRAVTVPWAWTSAFFLGLALLPCVPGVALPFGPAYTLVPTVSLVLFTGMLCLRALAMQRTGPWWWWSSYVLGMLLLVATAFDAIPKLRTVLPAGLQGLALPAWTGIAVFSAIMAIRAWRVYWQRPHAFVQE